MEKSNCAPSRTSTFSGGRESADNQLDLRSIRLFPWGYIRAQRRRRVNVVPRTSGRLVQFRAAGHANPTQTKSRRPNAAVQHATGTTRPLIPVPSKEKGVRYKSSVPVHHEKDIKNGPDHTQRKYLAKEPTNISCARA